MHYDFDNIDIKLYLKDITKPRAVLAVGTLFLFCFCVKKKNNRNSYLRHHFDASLYNLYLQHELTFKFMDILN